MCYNPCPDGTYSSTIGARVECRACIASCKTCVGSENSCSSCIANSFLIDNTCSDSCPSG